MTPLGNSDHTSTSDHTGSSDRSFGMVFSVVFAIIGLWPLMEAEAIRIWSISISIAFVLVAIIQPKFLATLNRYWTKFGLLLSRFTSPIVLGVMFFLVITPFAVVTRAFGRDALLLKPEPELTSYWIKRDPVGPEPDTIKNQF
jgi:predicted membrane metal-binding protein